MKKILVLLFVTTFCHNNVVKADDNIILHPIVFCNTDDQKIGESCANDQKRFVNEVSTIADALGLEVDWADVYTGESCNKPNLENAISNLNCVGNDIIFFYYSGHGVHAASDPADGWLPQMCLNYESYDQDKFVPVRHVRDLLAKKGARLTLILTDCCNNEANWVSAKSLLASDGKAARTTDIDINSLKKLFIDSKGTVIATSSKRGQLSLGPKDGGLFSIAFWDEMYRIEQGNGTPTWLAVMDGTKKRTLNYTHNEQEPVAEVKVDGNNNNVIINNNNDNVNVIAIGEKELAEAFQRITSTSYTKPQRLGMIDDITNKLFDSSAQVVFLGRNLKTKIGLPKPIKKYLEELALSKTVRSINVVTAKKTNQKYNYLEITEIR